MGLRVWGLGFRVRSLGFLAFRVWGLGLGVWGLGSLRVTLRVQGEWLVEFSGLAEVWVGGASCINGVMGV